jgi:outer membrane protein insertion porin family
MRSLRAQIIVATVCLLSGQLHTEAQSAVSKTHSVGFCDAPSEFDDTPPDLEISIAEVIFSGVLQMPLTDQDQIAASIKERTYGNSLDAATHEALERVRAGWQGHGYFKVQVGGDATILTRSPLSERITLNVHVDEGTQYHLGAIKFKHYKAIGDASVLRLLFPVKDGDIFSRQQIASGLENLQKAYGELGYINFTSVPNTKLDDEKKLAYLDIDLDEGKQFYFSSVNVLGLNERAQQEVSTDFPIGQVYNDRLFELFLVRHSSTLKFAPDDLRHIDRRLDEQAGTVAITLDARPCPAD